MNVHHLELFYYVARHGGISEAVRKMPYGIQQPAVSGQILQLEEFLGVTLFQRRPFALTPQGKKLFNFIEPFFADLDKVAHELQGGTVHQLRVGAAGIVLRDHLPELMQKVRKQFPRLKITLREGYEPELSGWLERQEIDFAITVIDRKPPTGIQARPLIELPLILLVRKNSRLASAEELWKLDRIDEPLICLPPSETMCKLFQQGLLRRGVDWFPSIEVSSVELIETYVAGGFGIGISVAIPHGRLSGRVRGIPLADFPPVVMGVLWRGKPSALMQSLFDALELRARSLSRP